MEVKIKGRSPVWIGFFNDWNGIFIHQLIFNGNTEQLLIFGLIGVNLVFLPIVVRNVVVIDDKDKMHGISETELQISHIKGNPEKTSKIFKNSKLFKKMILKGSGKEYMLVSVKDQEN